MSTLHKKTREKKSKKNLGEIVINEDESSYCENQLCQWWSRMSLEETGREKERSTRFHAFPPSLITRLLIWRGQSFEPRPTAGLVDDDSEDQGDDEEDSHCRQSVHLHVEVRRPSVRVFHFRFGFSSCASFSLWFGSKSLSNEDHRQQGNNAEARHHGQER